MKKWTALLVYALLVSEWMRVCLLQRITLKVEEGGSGGPVYIAVAAQDRYSPNMKFCPNRPNYHYQKLTEIPTRQNLSSNRLKTENNILEPLDFNLLRLWSVETLVCWDFGLLRLWSVETLVGWDTISIEK